MRWIGPFTVDALLDAGFGSKAPMPPHASAVYVVSQKEWAGAPAPDCDPICVGGNTSGSPLFRLRIGSLLADMFGFYGETQGHHSGGQTIHKYCKYCLERGINPRNLFIGWAEEVSCHRCAEATLYTRLKPKLNKNKPAGCPKHSSA